MKVANAIEGLAQLYTNNFTTKSFEIQLNVCNLEFKIYFKSYLVAGGPLWFKIYILQS